MTQIMEKLKTRANWTSSPTSSPSIRSFLNLIGSLNMDPYAPSSSILKLLASIFPNNMDSPRMTYSYDAIRGLAEYEMLRYWYGSRKGIVCKKVPASRYLKMPVNSKQDKS